MGWPRTKGLFIRKKVINSYVLWQGLVVLVQGGIALGALRPKIAVNLLADTLDWSRQPATELWNELDPSQQVSNKPDKPPEVVIADFPITIPTDPEEILHDLIAWETILTESFGAHCHWVFCQGLVWGLSHHEEALARHEEQRQKHAKNLPDMLRAGLKVHSPETLEEFADAMGESVNEFLYEIHPFGGIPQELLNLPLIATRLESI